MPASVTFPALFVLALAAGGCATASKAHDGPMLGYTDANHLYVVEHHDPEHGGRILGTVCAVDIQLDARLGHEKVAVSGVISDRHESTEGMHYDKGVLVVSSSSSELPYLVEARDLPGAEERDLVGSIGDLDGQLNKFRLAKNPSVDLKMTSQFIRGQVGLRHFDLRARGDDYIGSLTMEGQTMPYVLRGIASLWEMPPAAQASILPLLLTCSEPNKMIQLVDLRRATQPTAAPPAWLAQPSPTPQPTPIGSSPFGTPGTSPPPSEPARGGVAPQLAHR
ncbi:MAG: hypothetical protein JWM53_2198 [bacterium]|nr:hypothetical protein [bacterium]